MAKILLVEDDKSLREIYGVRLLAEGYDIVSAGDGEEALAMAIKERPDLIVSDVMMPKISGFDMLDILRSTTETKNIKVIMMTALSSEDQRQRGEQLGADRYLVKSQVGIEDVVRTVHDVLADVPTLSGQSTFAAPAPTAVPRPAPTTVPERPTTPAAPVTPGPAPTSPTTEPIPAPQTTVPTPTPTSTEQPTASASTLPQPTAPFSTKRPAGLADRIIQPLDKPESDSEPLASLMDKELGEQPEISPPPAPAVPPAPPVDTVPAPPAPEMPMPAPEQPVPPAQQSDDHGISFEETPRPQA